MIRPISPRQQHRINSMQKSTLWFTLALSLAGCYNYYPVGTPTPPGSSTATGLPEQAGTTASQDVSRPVPNEAAPSPRKTKGRSVPNQPTEQDQKEAAAAAEKCQKTIPDVVGRKAELVRCIVTSSDAVWDRADPQGTTQRRALGDYAIQLAEREDRGEISREQAEKLYQQFVSKNFPSLTKPGP